MAVVSLFFLFLFCSNNILPPSLSPDFSNDDCTILLIGGGVAVSLLLLSLFVLLVCVCILCRRWRKGLYSVPPEHETLELKRPYSSRSSNGAATGFSNANDYMSSHSYGKDVYPTSLAVSEFGGTLLSEIQRSVTPPAPSPVLQTPGTGCTGSMFSTDDQSSLTATLPNFPRRQLEVNMAHLHRFICDFITFYSWGRSWEKASLDLLFWAWPGILSHTRTSLRLISATEVNDQYHVLIPFCRWW